MTTEDYQEALYRRYVENRLRPGFGRHQRRVLPSIAESSVTLNFERVQKFAELEEAEGISPFQAFTPSKVNRVYSATSLDKYADASSRRKPVAADPRIGDYNDFVDTKIENFDERSNDFVDARSGDFDGSSGDFVDASSDNFIISRKNAHAEELAKFL